jgi:hypothetical protein
VKEGAAWRIGTLKNQRHTSGEGLSIGSRMLKPGNSVYECYYR